MSVVYSQRRGGAGFVFTALAAVLLVRLASVAVAQDSYVTVRAEDLVSAPQRYWARAIIFQDHVSAPGATRPVRIEDRRYVPFTTRIVGRCYAIEDLAPAVASLEVDRRYAFSGMVIQSRGRYYVIVSGVQPVSDAAAVLSAVPSQESITDVTLGSAALMPLVEIVQEVQSEHIAYAREMGIPLCELYDPQSVHFPRAMDIVRSAIMKREMEGRTVSSEMLAQYLIVAIARACTASAEPTSVANEAAMSSESPSESEQVMAPDQKPETTIEEEPSVFSAEPSPSAAEPIVSTVGPAGSTVEPPASAAAPHTIAIESSVSTAEPLESHAEEIEETDKPAPSEKRLSFWERWKARRAQRRAEKQRLAEEQGSEQIADETLPEIEGAPAETEQVENSGQEPESAQAMDEEWDQSVLSVTPTLDTLFETPDSATEEGPSSQMPKDVRSIPSEKENKGPVQMQQGEEGLESQPQEETVLEGEQSRKEAGEQEKQTRAEKKAIQRRETEEKKRLEEEQRALKEAAKRKADEARSAAELAASEARKRAAEDARARTNTSPQAASPSNTGLHTETPEPPVPVTELSPNLSLRQKKAATEAENQPMSPALPQNPETPPATVDSFSNASLLTDSNTQTQSMTDPAAEPSPVFLALPPERIEKLRREEEKHFERFRENMRREAERQERKRRQLEQEIQRQWGR